MKSIGALILVVAVIIGGFFYYQRETSGRDIAEVLKKHYGYSDSGYKFSLKSLSEQNGNQTASMSVTYLPEGISWDVACWNGFGSWDRSPEQMAKDMSDLNDISHCLKSLAGGLRVGDSVYNRGIDINSCRDAMKLYKIKHPNSNIGSI